jgi:putative chitinase
MTTLRMNRAIFFAQVRKTLFTKGLTQKQVDGLNALVDEYERRDDLKDDRQFAYLLATAYHETAYTMEPLREYGRGKGRKYGIAVGPYKAVYYGRGFVQLTWYDNYVLMGKLLGIPLAENPDLALDVDIAVDIIFEGMWKGASSRGDFTGKSLEDYISGAKCDYVGARRIINGTDKAAKIAGHAKEFEKALALAYAAQEIVEIEQKSLPPKPEIKVVSLPDAPTPVVVKNDTPVTVPAKQAAPSWAMIIKVVAEFIAALLKGKR